MADAPRGDVAIAVLAAGRGSRLGGDDAKPLARVAGHPLIAWALDAATGTGLDPIVVVTGYKRHEVGKVVSERFDGFKGITIVHNRRWKQGIASSLHAALEFIDPFTRVGAVCVGLADQPRVGSEAYVRLAAAYADGAEFAVATYDGQRANPVLLSRSLWAEARELTGDVGARALMQRHEVVEVPCDTTGSPVDVDTAADLERLNQETP
jgi:molybdenum cofactor cytidylyltransferase/nicotine blue oxidoreductase